MPSTFNLIFSLSIVVFYLYGGIARRLYDYILAGNDAAPVAQP